MPVSEEVQKRMITILSGVIAYAVADRLADRYLEVPDEPGIRDDIREAFIKGAFRFASTALASIVVRQVVSRRWGG